MHQGYINLLQHNGFVIAHEIQVIYVILTHFKVFQCTPSVRQFDWKRKKYVMQPCLLLWLPKLFWLPWLYCLLWLPWFPDCPDYSDCLALFGYSWDTLSIFLGYFLDTFVTYILDIFRILLGYFMDALWILLGYFWETFGIPLKLFWVTIGTFWRL